MQVYLYQQSCDDWFAILRLLQQLRPEYQLSELEKQVNRQLQQGYLVAYVKEDQDMLAVAGFSISEKLGWGKHLYIDDLVANEQKRSQGAGALLMDWLKDYAKQQGCEQIHLDSGVNRFAAHKFYLRENFTISSHHFLFNC